MPTEDEKRADEGPAIAGATDEERESDVPPAGVASGGRNGERVGERATTVNERLERERVERNEREARAERPERPERNERAERAERSERSERAAADKGDKDDRGLRDRLEGLVPDIVRKTFYAGLGALFTTEEGIRKLTNDFTLPKDVANYLLSSADGAKDEVLRILGRELHEFFARVNLSQELAKLLTQLSFEIKTEIRFIPNDEAVGGLAIKPDVKRKVSLKRQKDGTDVDDPGAD